MSSTTSVQKKVKEFFDEENQYYDRAYLNTEDKIRKYFFFEEEVIPKYLPRIGSCIDIGCGAGTFIEYIKNYYESEHAVGFDISDSMLNKFKQNNHNSSELTQGSILELPYRENQFDLVYMDDVIHHLVSQRRKNSKEQVIKALKNIKKITKPEGIFILREQYYESHIIPTISSRIIMFLLNLSKATGFKLPHKEAHIDLQVTFYTRKEINEIIESLGGKIIERRDKKWKRGIGDYLALVKNMGKSHLVIKFLNH